jgi:hypothetical protein
MADARPGRLPQESLMRPRTILPALLLGLVCTAAVDDAFAGKKDAAEQQTPAELTIERTGLGTMDQFFGQVQGLVDRLQVAQKDLAKGSDDLRTALDLATGTPLKDAFQDLKTKAQGKIKVAMEGNKPHLSASDAVPANVLQGIDAVNALVDADVSAATACTDVASQSAPLAQQAPGMVAKVPADAKSAGLKLTEIPGVTKKVKHNVDVTIALPGEAQKTLAAAKDSLDLVVSTFQ